MKLRTIVESDYDDLPDEDDFGWTCPAKIAGESWGDGLVTCISADGPKNYHFQIKAKGLTRSIRDEERPIIDLICKNGSEQWLAGGKPCNPPPTNFEEVVNPLMAQVVPGFSDNTHNYTFVDGYVWPEVVDFARYAHVHHDPNIDWVDQMVGGMKGAQTVFVKEVKMWRQDPAGYRFPWARQI